MDDVTFGRSGSDGDTWRLNVAATTASGVMIPGWSLMSVNALLIYDIRTVRTERQSVQLSKIEDGGLDQYVAEPFEQQQFGTAGVEGIKSCNRCHNA